MAHNYLSKGPHRATSVDLSAPAILKKLNAFRKTEWFNAILLVVLGLVAVGLFQFTAIGGVGVCLGILLPPVTVFVIPYWLGERRMKRYVLYIVPVLLIALVLIAALQTQAVLNQGKPDLTSGVDPQTPNSGLPALSLWNGTVEPYNTPSSNQTYAFHVRVKGGPGVNVTNATVYLNLSQLVGFSESLQSYHMLPDATRSNTTNGTWYVTWVPLGTNVYAFQFYAVYNRGNDTYSAPVLAPLLAPWESYYGVWLISVGEFMIYPASFYFVILFMYWYTIRARKMRARLIERSRGEELDLKKGETKEGEAPEEGEAAKASPPAPPRDRTKKAAAFTCTNCGADVSEEDTKCPKCGAVFED